MMSFNVFSSTRATALNRAMAYHDDADSLESLLDKATHRTNREEDWEYIISFCDRVNKEVEGPQIAKNLLLTKIACSPEWEALQALTVLEACMKNCGRRFQKEITRNHFLNYLFKLVWPEFLGEKTPEKVKRKIVELVCTWTATFPNESEFSETFLALKTIGVVKPGTQLSADKTLIPSSPTQPKHPVFVNRDMDKLLAELIQSKNPEDLREANRLIKNMVKEDEARVQKVAKRMETLEEVNNNVKLLTEMLSHYDKDKSSNSDREIIKELYERCDKLRSAAFKMATETEDNDTALGNILQASDDLSRAINSYKKVVEREQSEEPPPGRSESRKRFDVLDPEQDQAAVTTDTLIDLSGLDALALPEPVSQSSIPTFDSDSMPSIPVLPPPPSHLASSYLRRCKKSCHPSLDQTSASFSLLDDELLSLDLNDSSTSKQNRDQTKPKLKEISCQWASLQDKCGGVAAPSDEPASSHSLQSFQVLGATCFSEHKSLPSQSAATGSSFVIPAVAPPLIPNQGDPFSAFFNSSMPGSPAMPRSKAESVGGAPGSPLLGSLCPGFQGSPSRGSALSLSSVHVPLDAIKPSKILPVMAYNKDGVRVLLNFGSDCPPGRPDVLVIVVTVLNTAPLPVHSLVLHAAVPKSMKVKLQPPSGTGLAAFNPTLPPASVTQVLLLANPAKEQVRLRYKLTFTLGDRLCEEAGEVDQLPLPETWGHL